MNRYYSRSLGDLTGICNLLICYSLYGWCAISNENTQGTLFVCIYM